MATWQVRKVGSERRLWYINHLTNQEVDCDKLYDSAGAKEIVHWVSLVGGPNRGDVVQFEDGSKVTLLAPPLRASEESHG